MPCVIGSCCARFDFDVCHCYLSLTSYQTFIELLAAQLSKEYYRLRPLVNTARELVQKIRQTPPPEPEPDSPAPRAFDPQFARVLVSFIPLHIIRLPDQDVVWNKVAELLDSLDQLSTLAEVSNLTSWKVVRIVLTKIPLTHTTLRLRATSKYGLQNQIDVSHTSGLHARYQDFLSSVLFPT